MAAVKVYDCMTTATTKDLRAVPLSNNIALRRTESSRDTKQKLLAQITCKPKFHFKSMKQEILQANSATYVCQWPNFRGVRKIAKIDY